MITHCDDDQGEASMSAMDGAQSKQRPAFKSVMATADQDAVEKLLLDVLATDQIRAARSQARPLLEKSILAQTSDGQARLDYVLDAWLNYLACQEANADPAWPKVIWTPNGSTYAWFGHTVPHTGASIDCPDNIYRSIPVDPESGYEVHGQMRPMGPGQFSFLLMRDEHLIPSGADSIVMAVLSSRDMAVEPDGSFVVTIDSKPPGGRPNHLQAQPGPLVRVLIRDSVSTWLQSPNALQVIRTAGPPVGAAHDAAAVAARVAAKLSGWVSGWIRYISTLHGLPQENTLIAPYGRTGAWGYISFARFHLSDDQAMVITIDDGGAEYAAGQITDVWGILPDPQKSMSSHTVGQTRRNADGTCTYVVAARDPATANWMDTAGMHRGWVAFRWQGLPRTRTGPEGLVRDFRVVKISDLPSVMPADLCGVTPASRAQETATRFGQWRLRLAEGKQ
jgi:hypothetical protein